MAMNIDKLRELEFSRLERAKHIYLDHTGAALYPSSLLDSHLNYLNSSLLGNPHSSNPTSQLSTNLVNRTRQRILKYFNADPLKYDVVFTANASAATKLVAEAFPFRKSSALCLLSDNHNSVHGIREYAQRAGAAVRYIPLTDSLRAEDPLLYLMDKSCKPYKSPSLFAFPAQSNFSGVQHSLMLVDIARRLGWFVLLDAAAFAPTSRLDLSLVQPHFVTVSFYKMFGYPTGVGALILRKSTIPLLRRPWFSGGTVKYVSVQHSLHELADDVSKFEDGTLNFTSIPAVLAGIQFLENVGIGAIHVHVESLTERLLSGLTGLQWEAGKRMVRIYGPEDGVMRGGTIAFDLITRQGERVDARKIESAANEENISLRVGCFCNPGAAEKALSIDGRALRNCQARLTGEFSLDAISNCIGQGFLGCVRASVGLSSSRKDVDRFLEFVQEFAENLEEEEETVGEWSVLSDSIVKGKKVGNRVAVERVREPRKSGNYFGGLTRTLRVRKVSMNGKV